MAVLFAENMEAATTGAVSTSNSSFSSVTGTNLFHLSSTGTIPAFQGAVSMRQSSNSAVNLATVSISARTTVYVRFYYFINSTPTGTIEVVNTYTGSANNNLIQLGSDRKLQLWDNSAGTTATNALNVSTWYRVEWDITGSTQTLRYYVGNSTTAVETISRAATNTSFNAVRFGNSTTNANGLTVATDCIAIDGSANPGPLSLPSGPTIDSSSPATVTATGSTTTTASFTPPANSLLVAIVSVNNASGSGTVTGTVSDSVSSTWTVVKRQTSTGFGTAEVWMMDAGSSPSARTVTLTGTSSGVHLSVLALTGAGNLAAQGAVTTGITGTAYTASVTNVGVGSLLVGALCRSSTAVTLTANAFTTAISTVSDATNGATYASFRSPTNTTTQTGPTYGFTNAASSSNTIVMVEVIGESQYVETFEEGTVASACASSFGGHASYTVTGSGAATYDNSTWDGSSAVSAYFQSVLTTDDVYAVIPAAGKTHYSRFFWLPVGGPSSGLRVMAASRTAAGATTNEIRHDSTGKLSLWNGTTTIATSTSSYSGSGTWYRLEWDLPGTTTTLRIYSATGTTPLETLSGTQGATTSFGQMWYGSIATHSTGTGLYWLDDIAGNASSNPGAINTTVSKSDSDTGSGTDAVSSLVVAKSASDTGTGTDAVSSLAVARSAAETGTGTDAGSVAVAVSAADAATGVDAKSALAVTLSATDTGTGADAMSALSATLSASDTGTGVDAGSLSGSSSPSAGDVGSASEGASVTVSLSAADTGSGSDSGSVAVAGQPSGADTGTASEGTSIAVTVTASDTASLTDAAVLTVSKSASDSGSWTDSGFIPGQFNGTETGTFADAKAQLSVLMTKSETATIKEAVSVAKSTWRFTPPTYAEQYQVKGSLFVTINTAYTILKNAGSYTQVLSPTAEDVTSADIAYLGGRGYAVTNAEIAALTAAGYGSYIALVPEP